MSGVALTLGIGVAIFALFPNTAPTFNSPSSGKAERLPVEKPPPPTVPLSRAAAAASLQTAADFVKTAVLRQNVDASWRLTTSNLREGLPRSEWRKGDIPVVQFPASALREVTWRVGHSYRNDLELEVLLLPKSGRAGQGLGPITYVLDLKAVGGQRRKHWLVDAIRPYGLSQPPFSQGSNAAITDTSKLSAFWLLVPAMLLVVLALLPIGLIFRSWRASRRAERDYRAYRESANART
jgi:hypothetical protein